MKLESVIMELFGDPEPSEFKSSCKTRARLNVKVPNYAAQQQNQASLQRTFILSFWRFNARLRLLFSVFASNRYDVASLIL